MYRERDSLANEVKRLRNDFDRYLKAMQEMMFQHVSGPGSVLREEAFISVCDLLIFFCGNGEEGNEVTSNYYINSISAHYSLDKAYIMPTSYVKYSF